jgi:tRNA pseudouridine65 synthase
MIDIIFEDDYIICANKPNNMLVHHAKHSRNVSDENSLLQEIESQTGFKTFPVHRLDRKTSGIILLAKEKEYVSRFQKLFTEKSIVKTYYAIVRGHAPITLTIDSPVKGRDAKEHKEALTELETIEKVILEIPVKPYDSSRYSLVKLLPKTGRMHQLRVHSKKISHPIIGDPKYGDNNHNVMFEENFESSNLFLHAGRLEFLHPFSGENLLLKASFPNDWNVLFDEFKWCNPLV